jgi:mannan endo-1,4-beta-mannosidase
MCIGAAMLFTMAAARPATAQVMIRNVNSHEVLDVPAFSTSPGTLIEQWSFNSGTNQQWQVVPYIGGHYVIMNVNSGQALEVPNFSTDWGTLIDQWPFYGGDNQLWDFYPVNPGSNDNLYFIVNAYSRQMLDVPFGSTDRGIFIEQWPFNGAANQQWHLIFRATQLSP